MPPEVETHLVNAVLTNGARYYVDHAHPEYSSPECANVLDLIRYDKAGERILSRSIEAAARIMLAGEEVFRNRGRALRLARRDLPDNQKS